MEGEEWNTGHRTHHKQMTVTTSNLEKKKRKNIDGMFNPAARVQRPFWIFLKRADGTVSVTTYIQLIQGKSEESTSLVHSFCGQCLGME